MNTPSGVGAITARVFVVPSLLPVCPTHRNCEYKELLDCASPLLLTVALATQIIAQHDGPAHFGGSYPLCKANCPQALRALCLAVNSGWASLTYCISMLSSLMLRANSLGVSSGAQAPARALLLGVQSGQQTLCRALATGKLDAIEAAVRSAQAFGATRCDILVCKGYLSARRALAAEKPDVTAVAMAPRDCVYALSGLAGCTPHGRGILGLCPHNKNVA